MKSLRGILCHGPDWLRGRSHRTGTLASSAALITNTAVENRLEPLNKTDLKAVGQKMITEGNT